MKVRNLPELISVSSLGLVILSMVYPPIFFIWIGTAALLAAIIVYPDELMSAVATAISMLPEFAQTVADYILQPPQEAAFVVLAVLFSLILAPIILFGGGRYFDERLPDLESEEPPEL